MRDLVHGGFLWLWPETWPSLFILLLFACEVLQPFTIAAALVLQRGRLRRSRSAFAWSMSLVLCQAASLAFWEELAHCARTAVLLTGVLGGLGVFFYVGRLFRHFANTTPFCTVGNGARGTAWLTGYGMFVAGSWFVHVVSVDCGI